MMFTIDLLKGRGVPVKSGPAGVTLAVITIMIPVVVAIVMLGSYLNNKIIISVQENKISTFEKKVNSDELEHAVRVQKLLNQKTQALLDSLDEVSSAVSGHIQWTPILQTIVKNMPDSMLLTTIEVKSESKKVKKPKKDNPEKMIEVAVPLRVLHMSLAGNLQNNYDRVVRNFRDSLWSDESLGPKLEEIRVAQEFTKAGDRDVVSYEMYLIFKAAL